MRWNLFSTCFALLLVVLLSAFTSDAQNVKASKRQLDQPPAAPPVAAAPPDAEVLAAFMEVPPAPLEAPAIPGKAAPEPPAPLEALTAPLAAAVAPIAAAIEPVTAPIAAAVAPIAAPIAAAVAPLTESKHSATDVVAEVEAKGTTFNGKDVPPIVDLSGTTIKEDISKGYWLVEAFSPYCHHCKSLAPKWQTLYEFYYTSDPLPASTEALDTQSSLNSFSRYYNMKFAKLDCVAFGTACSDIAVRSFPTIILFKDGVEVKRSSGDRKIKDLSAFIEESLEIIRPGSRPQGGVELPKVGDTNFVTTEASSKGSSADTTEKSSIGEAGSKPLVGPIPIRPVPSTREPNVQGTSISFNADSFQQTVSKTLDGWFVKFYAPWCQHCQRMAPSWAQMAREMQGRLDVGEVNCDVERRLCRDYGVTSYPVIMFLKGPDRVPYEGLRGLGDFIDFGNKAVEASRGVRDVTATEFEDLEKTDEVIFVYFHDVATTTEDLMALDRLPLSLIGRAKIVQTNDPKLVKRFKITTWPRLLVSRDGKPTMYDGVAPHDIRNINKITHWMQSVWLPLVPELTSSNARDLMDGRFVVLGILTRERPEEMAIARRELKNAAIEWMDRQTLAFQLERQELRDAKQLRIEEAEDRNDQRGLRAAKGIRIDMNEIERKAVSFAWVDGIFWERYIKTTFGISVKEGEKVVINDEDNRRYWDNTITGNPIVPSRTSILETLPKIVSSPPKLKPKANGSKIMHYIFHARNAISSHPWIAAVISVSTLAALLVVWGRMRRRRRDYGSDTGGFFQVGGRQGGGILGSPTANGNGKAD